MSNSAQVSDRCSQSCRHSFAGILFRMSSAAAKSSTGALSARTCLDGIALVFHRTFRPVPSGLPRLPHLPSMESQNQEHDEMADGCEIEHGWSWSSAMWQGYRLAANGSHRNQSSAAGARLDLCDLSCGLSSSAPAPKRRDVVNLGTDQKTRPRRCAQLRRRPDKLRRTARGPRA